MEGPSPLEAALALEGGLGVLDKAGLPALYYALELGEAGMARTFLLGDKRLADEAVGHVMKLCEKHGAKPPAYVVELLCVQEFQDAQEWKGRGGAGRSRASAASNGDGPGLSLEGAEGMEGADAEALAQRILSHQLQADQHSLLCPVTHTHVLWDEGVAAKMYRAAAKD